MYDCLLLLTNQLHFYRRWGSTVSGGAATTRSTSSGTGAQQAFSRQMQRSVHVGRGRRSGVIVGTRPMVPASVVPEELISQVRGFYCQSNQTRHYKIGVCYSSTEHAAVRS